MLSPRICNFILKKLAWIWITFITYFVPKAIEFEDESKASFTKWAIIKMLIPRHVIWKYDRAKLYIASIMLKRAKCLSEVKTYNYGITRIVNRKGFKCIQTRDSQDVKIEKLNENLHALENVFFAAMEQIKFYQRNSDSKCGKSHLDVHDLTKNGGKHTKHWIRS